MNQQDGRERENQARERESLACRMCWKKSGSLFNGMRLCYACKSDMVRVSNFLESQGYWITTLDADRERYLDLSTGEVRDGALSSS